MLETFLFPPLVILLAALRPGLGAAAFASAVRVMKRLAASNRRAVVVAGLFSLGLNMGLTWLFGVPAPNVHDEFSYLLMGDTFAHGRLTNPPHPLWIHFESFHIIQQPTYASKYPVGQGIALALGQLLGGHPIVGVWLSTAAACAVICWMLLAFVPRPWALLGGLLAATHPTIAMQWGQSYWGGAVAMAGGALALGALRRITEAGRSRDAVLFGFGLAILANSRPYEGLIFSLPLTGVLLVWWVRCFKVGRRAVVLRGVLSLAAVLVLTTAFMAYDNWRVTGDPWRLPYQVYEATYGVAPLFVWQRAPSPPAYHHAIMRELYMGWAYSAYADQRSFGGWWSGVGNKFMTLYWSYWWSSLLALPLVALPKVVRRERWALFVLLTGVWFVLGLMPTTWLYAHYAAPAVGLFFLLLVQCLRELRGWRTGSRPVEVFLVHGTLLLLALSFTLRVANEAGKPRPRPARERFLRQLQSYGGKQLVLVRRRTMSNPHAEWVSNAADIEGARVVWAREMSPEEDQKLIEYFKDRQVWLVDADQNQPELVPYTRVPGDKRTPSR